MFFLILLVYLILGFNLLPSFQYQINADGAPLLAIAKAMRAGDLYHSINAYWGALSSLLLVPFLFLEMIQPVLVIKISNLFIGAFGLLGFYLLLGKYTGSFFIRGFTTLAAVPLFLYFGFFVLSSDLLIVTLLLHYLNLAFAEDFLTNKRKLLLAGLLGGLLVITKEYFLYFWPLHLGLILGRRNLVRTAGYALAVFAIISLTWAGLLTVKYKTFMFGSKGSVNFSIFSPASPQLPIFTEGLIALPNPYGLSSWDDPTLLNITPWSPWKNPADIIYLFLLSLKNFFLTLKIYFSFSILLIPLLVLSALIAIRKIFPKIKLKLISRNSYTLIKLNLSRGDGFKKVFNSERVFFYTLLTFLTYPIGYLIIYTEDRYLWPNYLLGIFLALSLTRKIPRFGSVIFLVILLTFLKTPVSYLKNFRTVDHTFYDQSKALRAETAIVGKNIASNSNWHQTLYLCLYLNCRYFGVLKPEAGYEEGLADLEKNRIDYYLSWNDDKILPKFRENFKEIKVAEVSNLRIFKLPD